MELKFIPEINYLVLGFIILSMFQPEMVNNFYNSISKKCGFKDKEIDESDTKTISYGPIRFFMLPILVLMYYDYTLKDDNWELKTGITNIIPVRLYNYILRIAGVYGLIQVMAQDIGLKTGLNQRNFTQNPYVQFLVLFGSAYSFTGFRGEALFGTMMYMLMKFNASQGKTSGVCFEDV